MSNLNTVELKPFIPSKDFEKSKMFYQDLGFTLASDSNGMAHFYYGKTSFLLQDFYEPNLANNFMLHLLVEDAQSWHEKTVSSGVVEKYNVKVSDLAEQPWGMLDFTMTDPCGILWRVGQNI